MKQELLHFGARWFVLFLLAIVLLSARPGLAQDIVLRGGRLFDSVRGELRPNRGILVRGGKLLEVDADLSEVDTSAARVIDLRDEDTILPGIFDLHAHYNLNLFGRRRRDEVDVNPIIFLANGVTSTFPAGEYNPEPMLAARKRIDRGEQIGPRIFNSGPYFGPARPGWDPNLTAEDIYAEVDLWAERGVAGFKAKRIAPDHLRALIERAHLHGLTVTGHLDSGFRNTVNPRDAILMGIDRVEHFLGGDALSADKPAYASLVNVEPGTPEFKRIVDLYISHNVFFDATLTAYGYFGERQLVYDYWVDERRFFTPYIQEVVRNRPPREVIGPFEKIFWVKQKTVKAFFDAGGQITLGTDHPSSGEYLSGFGAHREIEALARSGIPAAAVLQIATLNGARALNVASYLGSIEPGKFADIFVIDGNPLQDIRNTRKIKWVMKAGRLYDPQALLNSVIGKMGPANPEEAGEW